MFSYRIDDELQLTLLELRHAQELFELTDRNRTYLRQWLPWVDGTTTVDHTTWFIESTMQQFASNNGFQTAITYQGRIVGCIGLNMIAWGSRKTAIGYWLAADYQGKGMMTRSCRAIPEKLGFVQEGIVRQEGWQNDHFIDLVIYGMLAEDWNVVK